MALKAEILHARSIACPSWVFPGTVEENANFLEGKIDEIALSLYSLEDTITCTKLPPILASLDIRWHVHLPSDIFSNTSTPQEAGEHAVAIMQRIAHLAPHSAVIHPPSSNSANAIEQFLSVWCVAGYSPRQILWENVQYNDLRNCIDSILQHKSGICLDVGHLLAFSQYHLMNEQFLQAVGMLHLHTPCGGDTHSSLALLSTQQEEYMKALYIDFQYTVPIVIEVFSWKGVKESLLCLRNWVS